MIKKALERLYNYLDQLLYDEDRSTLEAKIEELEEENIHLENMLEKEREANDYLDYTNDFLRRKRGA